MSFLFQQETASTSLMTRERLVLAGSKISVVGHDKHFQRMTIGECISESLVFGVVNLVESIAIAAKRIRKLGNYAFVVLIVIHGQVFLSDHLNFILHWRFVNSRTVFKELNVQQVGFWDVVICSTTKREQ